MMRLIEKKSCRVLARALAALILVMIPLSADAVVIPTWTQTTQADFASGALTHLDIAASPGDVMLARNGTDYIFAFKGNNTNIFMRYDVAADEWLNRCGASKMVGEGGALAYAGGNYIYALAGGASSYTKYFMRYDISANQWALLESTGVHVRRGGALAYDNGNYIYALFGGGSNAFKRYNITTGHWETLDYLPFTVKGGAALVYVDYDGSEYLFALEGQAYWPYESTNFWCYDISHGTWTEMEDTPGNVGDGGALTWAGENFVYAYSGGSSLAFWQYDIASDEWDVLSASTTLSIMCYYYGGGALTNDGSGGIYGFQGNDTCSFGYYNTATGALENKKDTNYNIGYGGALAYWWAPYHGSGNLVSSAYDTGYAADFSSISWSAVEPAGTAIKFQIATNNDNATWVFKGPDGTAATYYAASGADIVGHDGNRFIKYKAFFSTTDTYKTPVLNDISISYVPSACTPLGTTGPATSVEETTATMNGGVDDDGGDVCQYRFQYGTAPGVYTMDTPWMGSVTTGQLFSFDITGLTQGTKYYFRAQVKNDAGIGSGSELHFLTKPEAPASLMASVIDGTQIDLSWVKGAGADRTRVLRKTGGYPVDYNDGAVVYFSAGTSVSDTGLSSDTMYYYRAWSEVTVGSSQQWSDEYKSVGIATSAAPSAATVSAALVEETTATMHGSVVYDGGEVCQYRFQYGTSPGAYTLDTGWTGSVTSGDDFHADVAALSKGTKYYFRAQVKNSAGIASGGELNFLTKPDPPVAATFTAAALSDTEIKLTWVKGEGALNTVIYRGTDGYPVDRNDGVLVYFNTGNEYTDTGLTPGTVYYYRAWSQVTGSEQWSDGYRDASAQTQPSPTTPPPTTPPPTTTVPVISVGGDVYPVNKAAVLAPWLAGISVFIILTGMVVLRVIRVRRKI